MSNQSYQLKFKLEVKNCTGISRHRKIAPIVIRIDSKGKLETESKSKAKGMLQSGCYLDLFSGK